MSKKQQLVNAVVERLVKAGVDFSQLDKPLDESFDPIAPSVPWDMYPEGYYNVDSHVDELLSTLDVENLEAILADTTPIEPGTLLGDIWFDWGDNLHLKAMPKMLDVRSVPVLRLRHDCYLALYREAGFKISKDAYDHNTAGLSWLTLGTALSLLRDWQKWPEEHGGLDLVSNSCALMILGYICNAGQELKSFYKALAESPELIDEFMWRTDEKFWKLGLRNGPSVTDLREYLKETAPVDRRNCLVSLYLCDKNRVFANLKYYRNAIQLDWETMKGAQRFVAKFPDWNEKLYIKRLSTEKSAYLDKERYTYLCWHILTQSLVTFANIVHNSNWCCYRRVRPGDGGIRSLSASLFDEYWCCNGFAEVYDILSRVARVCYNGNKACIS